LNKWLSVTYWLSSIVSNLWCASPEVPTCELQNVGLSGAPAVPILALAEGDSPYMRNGPMCTGWRGPKTRRKAALVQETIVSASRQPSEALGKWNALGLPSDWPNWLFTWYKKWTTFFTEARHKHRR
jgi:hypothetical protein